MKTKDRALRERTKALIVEHPPLKSVPSGIRDDQPLVDPAAGLGPDSIGVLERVVGLDIGQRVLRPVPTIAEFVKASGRKP